MPLFYWWKNLERVGKWKWFPFLHLTLIRKGEEKTHLGKPSSGWENNTRKVVK